MSDYDYTTDLTPNEILQNNQRKVIVADEIFQVFGGGVKITHWNENVNNSAAKVLDRIINPDDFTKLFMIWKKHENYIRFTCQESGEIWVYVDIIRFNSGKNGVMFVASFLTLIILSITFIAIWVAYHFN